MNTNQHTAQRPFKETCALRHSPLLTQFLFAHKRALPQWKSKRKNFPLDTSPFLRYTNLNSILKFNIKLQGRVQFPTGGTAHEPQGMIRCDSEADSTVWMKEDFGISFLRVRPEMDFSISGLFFCKTGSHVPVKGKPANLPRHSKIHPKTHPPANH